MGLPATVEARQGLIDAINDRVPNLDQARLMAVTAEAMYDNHQMPEVPVIAPVQQFVRPGVLPFPERR